jgi:hypothetical protein
MATPIDDLYLSSSPPPSSSQPEPFDWPKFELTMDKLYNMAHGTWTTDRDKKKTLQTWSVTTFLAERDVVNRMLASSYTTEISKELATLLRVTLGSYLRVSKLWENLLDETNALGDLWKQVSDRRRLEEAAKESN